MLAATTGRYPAEPDDAAGLAPAELLLTDPPLEPLLAELPAGPLLAELPPGPTPAPPELEPVPDRGGVAAHAAAVPLVGIVVAELAPAAPPVAGAVIMGAPELTNRDVAVVPSFLRAGLGEIVTGHTGHATRAAVDEPATAVDEPATVVDEPATVVDEPATVVDELVAPEPPDEPDPAEAPGDTVSADPLGVTAGAGAMSGQAPAQESGGSVV